MLVDDSAVVRGLFSRLLESDPGIKVITSVANGKMAVNSLNHQEIDVVVLDIEMPVMDGMEALPKMLALKPDVPILMASTLTLRNAEISMKALADGAADYLPKPASTKEIGAEGGFRRELLEKVRNLGLARRRRIARAGATAGSAPKTRPGAFSKPTSTGMPRTHETAEANARRLPGTGFTLREAGREPVEVVAIGSSTGGPQALFEVLKGLRGGCRQPILITQHMPATFTTILAQHINRMTGWDCVEGETGMPITGGRVLVAPGGYHMVVERQGSQNVIRLDDGPEVNFCRPAVDPLFDSIAAVYGGHALGIILTGMGTDGLRGATKMVEAGGTILAQNEATSVVWGMPGAAAGAGICSDVLPVGDMASKVVRLLTRRGR
ncbi:chemotaxis response regulator protein-glutamate methylesterase [Magnetospira sp. QH-2]|uniref:protein-glutamate methylesterase/protein-glutamine glutaminase n=1 Tax=Magnetospira sp. (strain QH-2) TaxID=1288970 RepID=UPI0005FA0AF2|nr:chemotaxis response regulator protein-glutamate methylesterase [Magnetospira sp. QH-2]